MKLIDIKPLTTLQESFVPGEIMQALQMLADKTSDNISHRFILARVAEYIKTHKITQERFRELNEFQPSPVALEEVRSMTVDKLSKLAKSVLQKIDDAMNGIEQDGYENPQDELTSFLNKPSSDR